MSYKIVIDSCGELPNELKKDKRFESVPLGLEVGDYSIMDDESFDQALFLKKVAESPACPKSSCPSPEKYMNAYHCEAENVFVVTLSRNLSGSYNSAELGKKLYMETYGEKNIHIVDSESASGGETQIALLAMELSDQGMAYDEICKQLDEYRDNMKTYFVLDNLETLRKNGRLTGVKAFVASTLNIKPVMGTDGDGNIIQLSQAIGIKKGLKKMVETILNDIKFTDDKRLIITHTNALARAELVRDMLFEKAKFADVIIMDTAGISSMYANNGGIIITIRK